MFCISSTTFEKHNEGSSLNWVSFRGSFYTRVGAPINGPKFRELPMNRSRRRPSEGPGVSAEERSADCGIGGRMHLLSSVHASYSTLWYSLISIF